MSCSPDPQSGISPLRGAWRSLRQVWPNSPGQKAGLEAFFDFIIAVNKMRLVGARAWHRWAGTLGLLRGLSRPWHVTCARPRPPRTAAQLTIPVDRTPRMQDEDSEDLKKHCNANVDREVELSVYNSKNQDTRTLKMTPTASWGGNGLLGAFCCRAVASRWQRILSACHRASHAFYTLAGMACVRGP